MRLFNTVVTPVTLYGASFRTPTQHTETLLRKAQRQMLRSMLREPRRHNDDSNSNDTDRDSSTESSQTASDHSDEQLEPWETWIQRATHKIEEFSRNMGVEDWVHMARRRVFLWAGHISRPERQPMGNSFVGLVTTKGATFFEIWQWTEAV